MGGFRAQGKTASAAKKLISDARLLQDAGCFGIVLESVPARLAKYVSAQLEIPTIGIGAGVGCDGQVLVTHDLLGFFDRFTPKFVKKYTNLHPNIAQALTAYKEDVESTSFPAKEHIFSMPDDEWKQLMNDLEE